MDIRTDTAKQYRHIRRILQGQEPETLDKPPGIGINKGWLWLVGVVFVVLTLWLICGCDSPAMASEGDINLDIIADIESGGDPHAINIDTGATGLYQITEAVVEDYNSEHEGFSKPIGDMFNSHYAWEVANWYFNNRLPRYLIEYHIPDTTTSRIIAYNWGIGHLRKWFKHGSHWNQLPKETRTYIRKYFAELKGN